MACEILTGKSAVFTLWGKPAKQDIDLIEQQLRIVGLRSGKPPIYITRVPVDAPAPEADVRKHLNSVMPRVPELCETYHVILEGSGFVAAMKRGILIAFFQIGKRRGVFFVHSSVSEVLEVMKGRGRTDVVDLLEHAGTLGLLTAPPPTTSLPPMSSQRPVRATSAVAHDHSAL